MEILKLIKLKVSFDLYVHGLIQMDRQFIQKQNEESVRARQYSTVCRDLVHVCCETNLVDVPSNSWWIDSGASVHISTSIQGIIHSRKARANEQLFLGNSQPLKV